MTSRVLFQWAIAGCMSAGLAAAAGSIGFASGVRTVSLKDQCDPATFNAAVGPGTCVGHNGGVSFETFLNEVAQTGKAGAWHFAPGVVQLRDGEAVQARNIGGEVHTFTEVEAFGGGIVPVLNQLSGNPVVAPECNHLAATDFIPPGAMTSPDAEEPGVHHYQCCIHPWMRADVVVR